MSKVQRLILCEVTVSTNVKLCATVIIVHTMLSMFTSLLLFEYHTAHKLLLEMRILSNEGANKYNTPQPEVRCSCPYFLKICMLDYFRRETKMRIRPNIAYTIHISNGIGTLSICKAYQQWNRDTAYAMPISNGIGTLSICNAYQQWNRDTGHMQCLSAME